MPLVRLTDEEIKALKNNAVTCSMQAVCPTIYENSTHCKECKEQWWNDRIIEDKK